MLQSAAAWQQNLVSNANCHRVQTTNNPTKFSETHMNAGGQRPAAAKTHADLLPLPGGADLYCSRWALHWGRHQSCWLPVAPGSVAVAAAPLGAAETVLRLQPASPACTEICGWYTHAMKAVTQGGTSKMHNQPAGGFLQSCRLVCCYYLGAEALAHIYASMSDQDRAIAIDTDGCGDRGGSTIKPARGTAGIVHMCSM
jgi:hypothetical protein